MDRFVVRWPYDPFLNNVWRDRIIIKHHKYRRSDLDSKWATLFITTSISCYLFYIRNGNIVVNIGNCPVVRVHYIRRFIGRDIRCLQLSRSDWAVRSFGVTATRCLSAKPREEPWDWNQRPENIRHYMIYIIIVITRLGKLSLIALHLVRFKLLYFLYVR